MITTKKSDFAKNIDTKRARTVFEDVLEYAALAEEANRAIEIHQNKLENAKKEHAAALTELYECLNHLKPGDSLRIVSDGDLHTIKVNHNAGRVDILVQDIDIDCDNT